MIAPTSVISVSLQSGTYITDGMLVPSANLLAFATSNDIIKLYNAATGSFVRDIRDHNGQITDMAQFGVPNQTSVLISSQRDTGILITDLRQPTEKPQYLTELQGSGKECFGIAVSPSGNQFALSANTDIHILDPRMNFRSLRHIPEMHTDVITKIRFVSENILCTGAEDMMLNIIDVSAKSEGDLLVSSISWGEAPNKLNVIGNRFITATGTMEGSIVQPIPSQPGINFDSELQNADWPLELKIPRPPLGSYLVDFVQMPFSNQNNDNTNNGELELGAVVGERPGASHCLDMDNELRFDSGGKFVYPGDAAQDDENEGKPQSLSIMRVSPKGIQPDQRIQLAPTHKDDVRCVIALSSATNNQGRLVTAGEDGIICFWDLNRVGMSAPLQPGQKRKPGHLSGNSNNNNNNDGENDNDDNEDNDMMNQEDSSASTSTSGGSGKEKRQRGTKAREQQQQQFGGRGRGGAGGNFGRR